MCHTTSEVFCLGFPFIFAIYCLTNYYIQFCKIVSNHKSTFSSYADFLTYKTAQGYKSKLGILQGVQKHVCASSVDISIKISHPVILNWKKMYFISVFSDFLICCLSIMCLVWILIFHAQLHLIKLNMAGYFVVSGHSFDKIAIKNDWINMSS